MAVVKVFVSLEPCDMRKGFTVLVGLVGERHGEDVRGGALFAFTNRRRTRLKLLYFNLVENAIRPTAIGKKNWLFMGSADAGQTGAILFTIEECCRRRGIDPFEYVRDVLDRIPSMTNRQVGELTPEAWAKARRPALRQVA